MLSRHGFLPTSRSLSHVPSRAFTASRASFLPRKKSDGDKANPPKSSKERSKPGPKKDANKDEKPTPLLGLLAMQDRLDKSLRRRTSATKGAKKIKPPVDEGPDHHDLKSFLKFGERNKLNPNTTVYKGTHYEYTVMEALKEFGFHLHRTGKANDKGIDLLGHWELPAEPFQMKVLVQCKVSQASPSTFRELEGAYAGAPVEWQGENVLALLASSKRLTGGVLEGAQRSQSPVGALHIEQDGLIRQFVWNAVAGKRGLAGLGVTSRYQEGQQHSDNAPAGVKQTFKTVALTWNGKPLLDSKASAAA